MQGQSVVRRRATIVRARDGCVWYSRCVHCLRSRAKACSPACAGRTAPPDRVLRLALEVTWCDDLERKVHPLTAFDGVARSIVVGTSAEDVVALELPREKRRMQLDCCLNGMELDLCVRGGIIESARRINSHVYARQYAMGQLSSTTDEKTILDEARDEDDGTVRSESSMLLSLSPASQRSTDSDVSALAQEINLDLSSVTAISSINDCEIADMISVFHEIKLSDSTERNDPSSAEIEQRWFAAQLALQEITDDPVALASLLSPMQQRLQPLEDN